MYRKLNRLCDILDGKSQVSHDPNPHGLMICILSPISDIPGDILTTILLAKFQNSIRSILAVFNFHMLNVSHFILIDANHFWSRIKSSLF